MRAKLSASGLGEHVDVDSAGTSDYHADCPPDDRSQVHATRRGYDLSSLRARQVSTADFRDFDLILAMDDDNLTRLEAIRPPDSKADVALLIAYGHSPHPGLVPDPYYGGPGGFELVLDLIEDACDGLVEHLRQRLCAPPAGPTGTS